MTDEFFHALVAAAASMEERLLPSFQAAPSQPRAPARLAQWAASVGETGAFFERLLAARGIDAAMAEKMVADVVVIDPEGLPRWADTLREFSTLLQDEEPGGQGASSLVVALDPWVRLGARRLDETIRAHPDILSKRARDDLLEQLGRRLTNATIYIFDQELSALRAASFLGAGGPRSLSGDRTAWLSRLRRYPALGRVLAITVDHWAAATSELCAHFAADRDLLGDLLSSPVGRIDQVVPDAGDVHDHGRAVVLLTLESGRRLVWKPKALDVAVVFQRLLAVVDVPPGLFTRSIRRVAEHTWEAFVPHEPAEDAAEVQRFYVRVGAQIRLLELLGSRDFWLDNLVAHRGHPVFIDLEMALQPRRFEGAPDLLASEAEVMTWLEDSLLPIGVVACRTPIAPGEPAEDLGALSHQRKLASPYRLKLSEWRALGLEAELTSSGYIMWEKQGFVPVLAGEAAVPSDHLEEVIAGYRRMNEALRERRSLVARTIEEFAGVLVRYIHRDTWTYQRALGESLNPRVLVDGGERDRYLERLFRSARGAAGWDVAEVRIAAVELSHLRALDIPMFSLLADGVDLSSGGALVLPSRFDPSPLSCVRERLGALDSFDVDGHVNLLRSCFSTGDHPDPTPAPALRAARLDGDDPDWLELSVSIGERLLRLARRGSDGLAAWVGLVDQPDMGVRVLEVLRPSLAGTAGLAMFFAELFARTGERTFAEGARLSLASTRHCAVEACKRWKGGGPPLRSRLELGLVYGIGAQLRALDHVAEKLGDLELACLAEEYAAALPLDALLAPPSAGQAPPIHDVITGSIGLLWGLAAGRHAAAVDLAARLEAPAAEGARTYPEGFALSSGLPDAEGGLALALIELPDEALSARGRAAALALGPPRTIGAALTRLAAQRRDDLTSFFHVPVDELGSRALLDRAELGLWATRRSDDLTGCSAARDAMRMLVARRAASGSWFCDRRSADDHELSCLDGLPAIGWAALRLSHPGPSPRLPGRGWSDER